MFELSANTLVITRIVLKFFQEVCIEAWLSLVPGHACTDQCEPPRGRQHVIIEYISRPCTEPRGQKLGGRPFGIASAVLAGEPG